MSNISKITALAQHLVCLEPWSSTVGTEQWPPLDFGTDQKNREAWNLLRDNPRAKVPLQVEEGGQRAHGPDDLRPYRHLVASEDV